jgi:hypothetical protein
MSNLISYSNFTLSDDKKEFIYQDKDYSYTEPNTALLFPITDLCLKDDDCEVCLESYGLLTPFNASLLSYSAEYLANAFKLDSEYLLELLPPVAQNINELEIELFIEAVAVISSKIRAGELPTPNSTAEELALHLTLDYALDIYPTLTLGDLGEFDEILTLLPKHSADGLFEELRDTLFEDWDVLWLYDLSTDGIDYRPEIGAVNLSISKWFTPFK